MLFNLLYVVKVVADTCTCYMLCSTKSRMSILVVCFLSSVIVMPKPKGFKGDFTWKLLFFFFNFKMSSTMSLKD